jgi:ACS family allantoate permease-like MFS transporter
MLIVPLGPQTFQTKDGPRFVPAEITIIVCWGVCLGILAFIHCYCVLQNKKKAQLRAAPDYVKMENQEYVFVLCAFAEIMLTRDQVA